MASPDKDGEEGAVFLMGATFSLLDLLLEAVWWWSVDLSGDGETALTGRYPRVRFALGLIMGIPSELADDEVESEISSSSPPNTSVEEDVGAAAVGGGVAN